MELERIEFPRDHYSHPSNVEWWWVWGRLSNGTFFHSTLFVGRLMGMVMSSLHYSHLIKDKMEFHEIWSDDFKPDGPYFMVRPNGSGASFILNAPHFSYVATESSPPVINEVKGRMFYSIPDLVVAGTSNGKPISGVGGMDHEWGSWPYPFNLSGEPSNLKIDDWECAAIKLNNGVSIGVLERLGERRCSVNLHGRSIPMSDFSYTKSKLTLPELGMGLVIEPIVEETIFRPNFGMKYSEQPLLIKHKGSVIGYGMREKTYGGMKYGNHSI